MGKTSNRRPPHHLQALRRKAVENAGFRPDAESPPAAPFLKKIGFRFFPDDETLTVRFNFQGLPGNQPQPFAKARAEVPVDHLS